MLYETLLLLGPNRAAGGTLTLTDPKLIAQVEALLKQLPLGVFQDNRQIGDPVFFYRATKRLEEEAGISEGTLIAWDRRTDGRLEGTPEFVVWVDDKLKKLSRWLEKSDAL